MPTFEEISARMGNAKVFSTLNGKKGFYQTRLAEHSQLLTTFSSGSFRRYYYLRVPYGLCSAPKVFHRTFKEIFSGLPGVEVYVDDEEQHLSRRRLKAVLQRAKEAGDLTKRNVSLL